MKKKAYAYSSVDLSIRHQKDAFCFPFSSSSSIFFNGGLRESLKLSYEHPMLLRPDSFSIESQKLSKNRSIIAWKTKGRRKTETTRGEEPPPLPWQTPQAAVVTTVQPWWPLSGWFRSCPVRCVSPLVLIRGLLVLGYLHWAFWACSLPL